MIWFNSMHFKDNSQPNPVISRSIRWSASTEGAHANFHLMHRLKVANVWLFSYLNHTNAMIPSACHQEKPYLSRPKNTLFAQHEVCSVSEMKHFKRSYAALKMQLMVFNCSCPLPPPPPEFLFLLMKNIRENQNSSPETNLHSTSPKNEVKRRWIIRVPFHLIAQKSHTFRTECVFGSLIQSPRNKDFMQGVAVSRAKQSCPPQNTSYPSTLFGQLPGQQNKKNGQQSFWIDPASSYSGKIL